MPNRTTDSQEAARVVGHILVVDDEKAIRGLTERILKSKGHRVTTCTGGAQAIDVYSKLKDEIDLVILDMLMPDITGLETLHRMKEANPSVRAILCSAFVPDLIGKSIAEAGFVGFISKPFRLDALLDLAESHLK